MTGGSFRRHGWHLLALILASWATETAAHDYGSVPFDRQVALGAGAGLNNPFIRLTLIPTGLLAALWSGPGKRWMWPALIGGQIGGLLFAVYAPPQVVIVALATSILTALLVVLAWRLPWAVPVLLATIAGLMAMMVPLNGHDYGTLPTGIYLGLGAAMAGVAAFVAGLGSGLLKALPYPAMRLGLRITASWVAAIAIMYLAFVLRGDV
jgi:hydrogenase/urease accessory protein HupE